MSQTFSYTGNDINSSPTAAKVAEVFLTAGHAFQKLGDLTLRLNQPISENTNETKWSEKDVDKLKEALSRFAHDLDNISDSVQSRIVQKIKTDIKRRTLISGGPSDPMLRTPLNTSIGGSNTTHFSGITFSSAISPASSSTSQGLGLSSNIGSIYSTAGSTQNQSFNRDVKNEYAASPPQLIPNSSTVQQNHNNRIIHSGNVGNSGFCGGIKRNALSSVSYGGSINLNNGSRVISSSVNGAPPFKKTTYGSGSGVITTFRPIRTISAAVNSSPGGGRSVSLLRSGITSQHNASNPNLSMQQHRLQSNQNINHSIHHNTPIFELDDDELDAINASGKLSGVHLPSINQQL